MLRPTILVSTYEKGVLKKIEKLYPRTFDSAVERVNTEISALQELYKGAKVSRTPQQVATVEIDGKQRIKIEIVERF